MTPPTSSGPLFGVRVVEFAGIGPAPFCGMLLSHLGATVLRIDRESEKALAGGRVDLLVRGRTTVMLDLKSRADLEQARVALDHADVLIEGFRPGVMERLGLGPSEVRARNPRLVYGRVTGWGQDGPYAHTAGHDINYIGLAGALHPIGPAARPVPPLNLVGDFGGGGMLLAVGVLAALLEARVTGQGRVVDAAMVDGAALLMAHTLGLRASGMWSGPRGANVLDGGAHFYRCYRCADDRWVAVGAIETRFYQALLNGLGLSALELQDQWNRDRWPAFAAMLEQAFASQPRDEWLRRFTGTDACVTPVLDWDELTSDPHLRARATFTETGDGPVPASAPRFSPGPRTAEEADAREVLRRFGLAP